MALSLVDHLKPRTRWHAARTAVDLTWFERVRPAVERRKTFAFAGSDYAYFYHRDGRTWNTERALEIPIAARAIRDVGAGSVLEVGNVMRKFLSASPPSDYTVVDLYEQAEGVVNVDILDYETPRAYDLIVSVSTLEHVGLDEAERDYEKARRAAKRLSEMVADGGRMLTTWAVGYNRDLDDALVDGYLQPTSLGYLRRTSAANKWRQVPQEEGHGRGYGRPYPAGNALVVAEWRR